MVIDNGWLDLPTLNLSQSFPTVLCAQADRQFLLAGVPCADD